MKSRLATLYDRPLLPYSIAARDDVPSRTDLGPAPPLSESKVTLYGRQGGHCKGCATHFQPQHLTIDHIIPDTAGGTDHLVNL